MKNEEDGVHVKGGGGAGGEDSGGGGWTGNRRGALVEYRMKDNKEDNVTGSFSGKVNIQQHP